MQKFFDLTPKQRFIRKCKLTAGFLIVLAVLALAEPSWLVFEKKMLVIALVVSTIVLFLKIQPLWKFKFIELGFNALIALFVAFAFEPNHIFTATQTCIIFGIFMTIDPAIYYIRWQNKV